MDLTDPFVGLVPRKMTDEELARAIRLNIAAEIDAINLYAAHMDATDNESARKLLAHIIDEEKEHLAEFLELLKILDPKQATEFGEAGAKLADVLAAPVGEYHDPGDNPPAEPPRATVLGKQPTVGSLRQARK
jgi:rubrerythrin